MVLTRDLVDQMTRQHEDSTRQVRQMPAMKNPGWTPTHVRRDDPALPTWLRVDPPRRRETSIEELNAERVKREDGSVVYLRPLERVTIESEQPQRGFVLVRTAIGDRGWVRGVHLLSVFRCNGLRLPEGYHYRLLKRNGDEWWDSSFAVRWDNIRVKVNHSTGDADLVTDLRDIQSLSEPAKEQRERMLESTFLLRNLRCCHWRSWTRLWTWQSSEAC